MPIDLKKLQEENNKNTNINKPSYFDTKLTGQGGKTGLLNQDTTDLNKNIENHTEIKSLEYKFKHNYDPQKRDLYIASVLNQNENNIEIDNKEIPLSPLHTLLNANEYHSAKFHNLPHFIQKQNLEYFKVNKDNNSKLEIGLIPEKLNIQHTKEINDSNKKYYNFKLYLDLMLFVKKDNSNKTKVEYIDKSLNKDDLYKMNQPTKQNTLFILKNYDPYNNLNQKDKTADNITNIQNIIEKIYNFDHINTDDIINHLQNQNINLTDIITNAAKANHENILKDVPKLFKFSNNTENQFKLQRINLILSYDLINHEEKNLTDIQYGYFFNRIKYQTINRPSHKKQFQYNNYYFSRLLSVNSRLSLISKINQLADNKNVFKFEPKQNNLITNKNYSDEQQEVIKTTKPYTVIMAGAGSGKSHTLLGRIKYLQENKIPLNEILTTSFSNAAADNIINRFNNQINSVTNANLFHQIYQENFDHALTKDATLVNLLKVVPSNSRLMTKNNTINKTRLALIRYIGNSISNGFKKIDARKVTEDLVALINENMQDVIDILNNIKETSLLLEPIIINALMQNDFDIKFPKQIQNLKFIITDESQDTSTFEYILILQLARINNAQLMIMGDSNQTLYEFRNANPDFLNALEASNTFKCYNMSTNYRSKQSILTFTNEFLNVLKTNQYSNLQLHSNKYTNLNTKEFKNEVKLVDLNYKNNSKKTEDKENALRKYIYDRSEIQSWIVDQYENSKQIAVMAFRNKDAQVIGDIVKNIIDTTFNTNASVGFTRKPQPKDNTWLSQMISSTHDENLDKLINKGHVSIMDLAKSFKARLQAIADKKKYAEGEINYFAKQTIIETLKDPFIKSSVSDFNKGKLSYNALRGRITMKLIRAETQKNNVKRYIKDPNNDDPKWQDADIVISTIHSAKGLEFDSTICYFDEYQKSAANQANLRLYGVALTRAKDKELIINHSKEDSFGHNESDMFSTPMRTGYARVLDKLNSSQI